MDLDQPTPDFIGRLLGATAGASMYQTAAVVMALAQRGAIDPLDVARNAEFFAKNQPAGPGADIAAQIAEQLTAFANVIRSMSTVPQGAGRA